MKSRNFFAEVKRRNVDNVAVVYAFVSWIPVQWRADSPKTLPPNAVVKTRIVTKL
jgi:hypothetical protein